MIGADLEEKLYAYMGGIVRDMKEVRLEAGGIQDHVHLLVSLGRGAFNNDRKPEK